MSLWGMQARVGSGGLSVRRSSSRQSLRRSSNQKKKPICDDVTLFSDKSSVSVSSRRSWKRLEVTYNVALSLKTCVKTINSNEKSFNFASVLLCLVY